MPTRVQFYTYGINFSQYIREPNLIYEVDCSQLPPPPKHLCRTGTGLDDEVATAFWHHRQNEDRYRQAAEDICEIIQSLSRQEPGRKRSVSVAVFCKAGMHRSVAMAERLARHFGTRYGGVMVLKPRHYDLAAGVRRQQARLEKAQLREEMYREEGYLDDERLGRGYLDRY